MFGVGGEPVLLLVEVGPEENHRRRSTGSEASPRKTDSQERLLEKLARLTDELASLERSGLLTGWSSVLQVLPPPSEQHAVVNILRRKDRRRLESSLRRALKEEGFDIGAFDDAISRFRRALGRRELLDRGTLESLGLGHIADELLSLEDGRAVSIVPVYPAVSLWDPDRREEVLSSVSRAMQRAGVDGEVSGLHAVSTLVASHVVREFLKANTVAFGVIVVVVISLFRSLRRALPPLTPVTLGCIWTAVAWSCLGCKLNFMNVGILAMILGIGSDDGIHLVARFWKDPNRDVRHVFSTTGRPCC